MPIPQPLTPQEVQRYFIDAGNPPPDTFEFALVLGGTTSAGAYTAGAVDFLIEALDEWTSRRDASNPDPNIPPHKAVLKLVTGTSGGGVNSAVLARSLAYEFPHVTRGTDRTLQKTGNPFYDLWVNNVSLTEFLSTSDIAKKQFVSLLNGAVIDFAAAQGVSFVGTPRNARSWVAAPLRVILTLTNLHGVPYQTFLSGGGGNLSETFIDHADFARFAFVYPGQPFLEPRPDEFVLGFGNDRFIQALDWPSFGEYTKATAAFPLGFPARALQRPMEHYRWRVAVLPGDGTPQFPTKVVPRVPDWNALIPSGQPGLPVDCQFLVVDGGATDNEPIQLARTALAGMLGRNPRDPVLANRGVVLVDPFAGAAPLGPTQTAPFADLPAPLIQALVQQIRYDTSDLLLALDDTVSSRFMVTPVSPAGVVGEKAIASAAFMAFIGFACRDFMRYDYLLGRANAQAFLKNEFLLDADNPVFRSWPAVLKTDPRFVSVDANSGRPFLPIIPLVGTASVPEALDPWPKHKLNPEVFRDSIETRFRAIVEYEGSGGLISSVAAWAIAHLGQKTIADLILNGMKKALKDWNLD